jgi:hypothetical protein
LNSIDAKAYSDCSKGRPLTVVKRGDPTCRKINMFWKQFRRATRMVSGFKDISYEKRLKRMNLTTLETRRLRADLLEVYKIITRREGVKKIYYLLGKGKNM